MARIVPATPEWIAEAADVIRGGGLIAMPTETVYGLAANALDPIAVAQIFSAKGRPANNPLIVHINTAADLETVVKPSASDSAARALAAAFWPGPLTLVLPRREGRVPDIVTAGGQTVAVRRPNHPVALALIAAAGLPLAAPSANRSEAISPTRPEHVAESLGDAVDLILDGGPCNVGIESTVLSLIDPENPRLLRPGAITPEQIAVILGAMPISEQAPATPRSPLASPGQMRRHYAPSKRLLVAQDLQYELSKLRGVGVIARTEDISAAGITLSPDAALRLMPSDADAYGREIYAALRELDADASVQTILLREVPDTPEWLAVRDRLQRASAPKHAV